MYESPKYRFLTSDPNLSSNKDYIIISDILDKMAESGALSLATGYCFSASDMVRTALNQLGIKSNIVECQLTITDLQNRQTVFVGFDNIKRPGEIGTHVVVITQTDPPFLIDASLANRLPLPAIVEPIKNKMENIILDQRYLTEQVHVTYQQKEHSVYPKHHQLSIIERINTDRKIFDDINFLKKLNYIGIGLSLFAVVNVLLKVLGVW